MKYDYSNSYIWCKYDRLQYCLSHDVEIPNFEEQQNRWYSEVAKYQVEFI